jgi:hypothetical protein
MVQPAIGDSALDRLFEIFQISCAPGKPFLNHLGPNETGLQHAWPTILRGQAEGWRVRDRCRAKRIRVAEGHDSEKMAIPGPIQRSHLRMYSFALLAAGSMIDSRRSIPCVVYRRAPIQEHGDFQGVRLWRALPRSEI